MARTFVALLRGINVGGSNIIPMADLAKAFEKAGYASVKTYIQSGNVLFKTPEKEPGAIEANVTRFLSEAFRYDATVVVRSIEEMARVVDELPRAWKKPDPEMRYNIMFLGREIDALGLLESLAPKPGVETVFHGPGVLYWSALAADVPRSAMGKLSSKRIYKQMTVRNVNTTKKVLEMMLALG
jgi:uncharacterized protein (DUF1697 family)